MQRWSWVLGSVYASNQETPFGEGGLEHIIGFFEC